MFSFFHRSQISYRVVILWELQPFYSCAVIFDRFRHLRMKNKVPSAASPLLQKIFFFGAFCRFRGRFCLESPECLCYHFTHQRNFRRITPSGAGAEVGTHRGGRRDARTGQWPVGAGLPLRAGLFLRPTRTGGKFPEIALNGSFLRERLTHGLSRFFLCPDTSGGRPECGWSGHRRCLPDRRQSRSWSRPRWSIGPAHRAAG